MSMIKPAVRGAVITPSDGGSHNFRAIYIGTGGDLAVLMSEDGTSTPVVFKNVPSGTMLPISIKQVRLTATTALDLVGVL